MDDHNPWWVGEEDHTYERWRASEPRWTPAVVEAITLRPYSLHFLQGPRQVGKTTSLKLLVRRLLDDGRDPRSLFYYSCDEVTNHAELGEVLDGYLGARGEWGVKASVILLDEVTMVGGWWRALKARVDRGEFRNDVLVVTGSAGLELGKHKEYFPGRRGGGADHHMHPLSFREYCELVAKLELKGGGPGDLDRNVRANMLHQKKLKSLLGTYLKVGGFPLSVIEHAARGKVTGETNKVYLDWARGDWGRAGRSDGYMKEVLSYLLRARGTPISWNGISSETSIGSPNTARTYVETLEGLFAAVTLPLLFQDGKVGFRRNRKVHFTDPLLYHAFSRYTGVEVLDETVLEAAAASHLARVGEVYYYKNRREVDVVLKDRGKVYGFEVTMGTKRPKKPLHMDKYLIFDRDTAAPGLASLDV